MTADSDAGSQHLSRKYGLYTLFVFFCIFVGIATFVTLPRIVSVSDHAAPESAAHTTGGTHVSSTVYDTRSGYGNVTVNVRLFSSSDESLVSLLSVVSKTIVVRRAYFDYRKRDGHENAVVFVMEIKRSIPSKMFTGCRVGGTKSSNVRFRYAKQEEWAIKNKHVTKNIALVDCYDVHGVKDGDPAYLIVDNYKSGSAVIKRGEVKSLQNLVVPSHFNGPPPTVVVCLATVHVGAITPSEDGMLHNWIRYQKTIGVDHVHMIADDTFVIAGGMDNAYIQDAVKENYLSVDFWPRWFNETEMYHCSMQLGYNDCIYRFMGAYDYVVIADSDDFFVPLKSKSIKPYLTKWCSDKTATCEFRWQQFYPDCGWSPKSVGADGNLTATVYYSKTTKRPEPKSVHQIRRVVDVGVHSAMVLMSGYKQKWVPFNEAYFAHVRKRQLPRGGC